MQLLSVNVGHARLIQHNGQTVSTAIFKEPVAGSVEVGELGIAGDDQADKSVHGGIDKAVYAYPEDNYRWWRQELAEREFPPGTFGENLTWDGLTDEQVQVGDQFQVGTAVLEVTQPRTPCLKLGIKMSSPQFVKRFHQAGRPGFYLRVLRPGTLEAGVTIEQVHRAANSIGIAQLYRLLFDPQVTTESLQYAMGLAALSVAWRDKFQELLNRRSSA